MSELDLFKEQLNSKLESYKSLFDSSDGWDLGFKACCEMIQNHLKTH